MFDQELKPNPINGKSIKELAAYVEGYAKALNDDQLMISSRWLYDLSRHICGQGFIGCNGGSKCSSDHK